MVQEQVRPLQRQRSGHNQGRSLARRCPLSRCLFIPTLSTVMGASTEYSVSGGIGTGRCCPGSAGRPLPLPGECVPRRPGLQISSGHVQSLNLPLGSVRVSHPSVLPLRAGVLLTVGPGPRPRCAQRGPASPALWVRGLAAEPGLMRLKWTPHPAFTPVSDSPWR